MDRNIIFKVFQFCKHEMTFRSSIHKEINNRENERGNERYIFLKLFLTNERINEIVRETNNHAIKKLENSAILL